MSETETITSNPRVLGADPLVKIGIGEEDLLTIVLPYIRSAREGVKRLGMLLEQYGTYEMNGIGFQDRNEIWWMETIGGHHWLARRVPDDAYVVMPNQQGIDRFDFTDAFGEQKDHMCSADMAQFITEHHLDLSMAGIDPADNPCFDVRAAFGSRNDSDHVYNTPRAWFMLRTLNPHLCRWDSPDAKYTPESDDLPWCMVPEHKLTVEDFKYVLSSYYQGTEYNPYGNGDASVKGKYRVIGINRNNFLSITQIRPYLPEEIRALQWVAMGSNAFNTIIPFYANVTITPEYMSNTDAVPTTESFYWANRIVGALADAHYASCQGHVERYQHKTLSMSHKLVEKSDAWYLAGNQNDSADDIHKYLEACNEKIADMVKTKTSQLLDNVLFTATSEMKNAFSMSEN